MRAALVLVVLALAGPALAQDGQGLEVQTFNGIRVWRPKPAPARAAPPAAPQSTTIVVVNTPPPVAPEAGAAVIGLPIGVPFFHRRPFFPHHRPPVRHEIDPYRRF